MGADGSIYWGNGGTFNGVMTLNVSVLDDGTRGTTLAQEIVRADGGVGEVNGSGQPEDMSGITNTLGDGTGRPDARSAGSCAYRIVWRHDRLCNARVRSSHFSNAGH